MPKFRMKTHIVEAMQWDGSVSSVDAIDEWTHGACSVANSRIYKNILLIEVKLANDVKVIIRVEPHDWIVKGGPNGDFHPYKPDVFEQTYEAVDGETRETDSP